MHVAPKLNQIQRKAKVAALIASGMTQADAAKALGVNRSTIQRDLEDIKPAIEEVKDLQARATDYIEQHYPIEQRIDNYVILSKHDPNGSVRHAATARLDDMQGFVPQRDLIKVKQGDQQGNQPLFVFQSGAQISFGPTTIGGDAKSLHKTTYVNDTPVIDVTPESHKGGTVNKDSE